MTKSGDASGDGRQPNLNAVGEPVSPPLSYLRLGDEQVWSPPDGLRLLGSIVGSMLAACFGSAHIGSKLPHVATKGRTCRLTRQAMRQAMVDG